MKPYFQVNDRCNGCLACVQNCPANALRAEDSGDQRTLAHNMARCARCATCWRVCPQEAIEFEHILVNEWDHVVSLELRHCEICGADLYTTRFEETVAEKAERSVAHRCSEHREEIQVLGEAYFPSPGKTNRSQKGTSHDRR